MPLDVFAPILTRHPDQLAVIGRLRDSLVAVLRADPAAVIDSHVFAERTHISETELDRLLVELAGDGALSVRFFWLCPATHSEASEASAVAEFPLVLECSKCGQSHRFSVRDVEVGFLASAALLDSLRPMLRG
jgi:hypothetical protein